MTGTNTHARSVRAGSQRLQLLLNRRLLCAIHNIANHRARSEIAAVQRVSGQVRARTRTNDHGRIHGRHSVRRGGGTRVQLTCRRRNHRGQGGAGRTGGCHLRSVQGQVLGQVQAENLCRTGGVRAVNADLQVESARAHHGGIDEVFTVGRTNDDDVLQRLHTVNFGKQLRHDGRLNIGGTTRTAHTEQRLHLVKEHDDRVASLRLFTGGNENIANLTLGLTDELIQQLGALNVQEVAAGIRTRVQRCGTGGQGVRHGLSNHGLTVTGRTVQQNTLGRRQVVALKNLGVQVRQLHRVANLLNLSAQATNLLVGDIRNLFQNQLLRAGGGNLRGNHAGARVKGDRIPCAQLLNVEGTRHTRHLLSTRGRINQHALLIQHLTHGHHVTEGLGVQGEHRLGLVVEQHGHAGGQRGQVNERGHGNTHHAAAHLNIQVGVNLGGSLIVRNLLVGHGLTLMHRQHNRRIQRRHNVLRQGRAQTLHLVAHAGDCLNELAVLLPRTTNLSAHIVAGCLRRGESTQHGVILLRADGLTAGQGGRPESSRVVRCRAGCTVGGAVLGGSCLICRFVGGHGSSFSCSS